MKMFEPMSTFILKWRRDTSLWRAAEDNIAVNGQDARGLGPAELDTKKGEKAEGEEEEEEEEERKGGNGFRIRALRCQAECTRGRV